LLPEAQAPAFRACSRASDQRRRATSIRAPHGFLRAAAQQTLECAGDGARKLRVSRKLVAEDLPHAEKGSRKTLGIRPRRFGDGAQALGERIAHIDQAPLLVDAADITQEGRDTERDTPNGRSRCDALSRSGKKALR